MEQFLEKLKENKLFLGGFIALLLIIILSNVFTFFYLKYEFEKDSDLDEVDTFLEEETLVQEDITKVTVEIKGEVKKPGVYEVNSNKRVNDVISLAEGLTKNADTSVNNLSKKVADEMIIIIYSKDEVKSWTKTKEKEDLLFESCVNTCMSNNNSCLTKEDIESNTEKDEETKEKVNKLVSINKASLDELMTLPGIGESKAKAIISYREKTKFTSIEDLKKVTGIGENLYAQVKDFITT